MSTILTDEQFEQIQAIVQSSKINMQDVTDVLQSLAEIIARSGYGRVEIILEGHEVNEIVVSHRRKPKVERRSLDSHYSAITNKV